MKQRTYLTIYLLFLLSLVSLIYFVFREKLVFFRDTYTHIEDNNSRLNYERDVVFCDDVCVIMFSDTVKKIDIVNAAKYIRDCGASVVGVDFFFQKDIPNPADSMLVAMAKADERIVLTYELEQSQDSYTPRFYCEIDNVSDVPSMGYSNLGLIDGVIRRLHKTEFVNGVESESFATKMCEIYLGRKVKDPRDLINFLSDYHQIDYNNGLKNEDFYKDKIVILGCKTINDYKLTPGRLMFGTETHATAVSTILINECNPISFLKRVIWPFLIITLCVFIFIFVFFRNRMNRKDLCVFKIMEELWVWLGSFVFSLLLATLIPAFDDYWWSLVSIPLITSVIYSITKEIALCLYNKTISPASDLSKNE